MKKVKMLLIILCVAMMFLGFVGCKKDNASSNSGITSSITHSNSSDTVAAVDNSGEIGGAAAVPEPTTLVLLGAGLVGLAGVGRKKIFKKD